MNPRSKARIWNENSRILSGPTDTDAHLPRHRGTLPDTGLYVGYVPGFPGAHSQGDTFEELDDNLGEVIAMLLDDGEPVMGYKYVGTQTVVVA